MPLPIAPAMASTASQRSHGAVSLWRTSAHTTMTQNAASSARNSHRPPENMPKATPLLRMCVRWTTPGISARCCAAEALSGMFRTTHALSA